MARRTAIVLLAVFPMVSLAVILFARDEGYWVPVRVPVQAFVRPCNDDYCECVRWGMYLTLWRERYRAMDGPSGDFDLRAVARMMP